MGLRVRRSRWPVATPAGGGVTAVQLPAYGTLDGDEELPFTQIDSVVDGQSDLAMPADQFVRLALSAPEARSSVVEGIYPSEGLFVMVGEPGALKTMATLQAAACIANGLDYIGLPSSQWRVVYVLYEGQRIATAERIEAQRAGLGLERSGFDLIWKPPAQLEDEESFADLVYTIEQRAPCFVVIDPYAESHGLDEVKDSGKLLSRLREVERAAAGPVLLLHHPNQDTKASRAHRVRGHGSLVGKAEVVLWMDRPVADVPEVTLSVVKVRDGEAIEPIHVRLNPETLLLEPTEYRMTVSRLILDTLLAGPMSRELLLRDVVGRTGKSRRAATGALKKHLDAKRVTEDEAGMLTLATEWQR